LDSVEGGLANRTCEAFVGVVRLKWYQ